MMKFSEAGAPGYSDRIVLGLRQVGATISRSRQRIAAINADLGGPDPLIVPLPDDYLARGMWDRGCVVDLEEYVTELGQMLRVLSFEERRRMIDRLFDEAEPISLDPTTPDGDRHPR
jgi:hypothetical protein